MKQTAVAFLFALAASLCISGTLGLPMMPSHKAAVTTNSNSNNKELVRATVNGDLAAIRVHYPHASKITRKRALRLAERYGKEHVSSLLRELEVSQEIPPVSFEKMDLAPPLPKDSFVAINTETASGGSSMPFEQGTPGFLEPQQVESSGPVWDINTPESVTNYASSTNYNVGPSYFDYGNPSVNDYGCGGGCGYDYNGI